MRYSLILSGLAVTLITSLCLRHHLEVLSEVVRTYSTFYPYLDAHPEVLFRYHDDVMGTSPTTEPAGPLIPRMLHQIHLEEGRPSVLAKHQDAIDSCRDVHAGWNHTIWTDESASAFMEVNYPAIWPHYLGYKQSIQRANILRYALLDHFGGVYLDLDVTCRQSLEPLRTIPWLSPAAHPAGVNNAFIQARQGHPFLQHLLQAVPSRDLSWRLPYIENMLSTGCMYFSNMWMSYARNNTGINPSDNLYILANEQGGIESHMLRGIVTTPLFKHGGASSWHGWDAAMIVLIGKYYTVILQGCLALCLFTVWAVWRFAGGRNRRRRSSWGSMVKRAVSPVQSPQLEKGIPWPQKKPEVQV
jgi:mannosyltransferase OCH1-like enzyme